MLVIFAIENPAPILSLALGLFGVCGIIFTALKYNRDDTTTVLNQQTTILDNMKTVNDELRMTAKDLRTERDELRVQVQDLTAQVKEMRDVGA